MHFSQNNSNVLEFLYRGNVNLQSPSMPRWQNDYMRGTGMEMYTEYFSYAFHGSTFPEASELVLVHSFNVNY